MAAEQTIEVRHETLSPSNIIVNIIYYVYNYIYIVLVNFTICILRNSYTFKYIYMYMCVVDYIERLHNQSSWKEDSG